ncbi:MAG TPA: hypothetical protein PKK43_06105 [Spirochaetota bacterium]|mgnify:CR=1 FL=1|nr:hypothetical protein [Spirochaetota bacterium]
MKGKKVTQWISRRSELSGFEKAYFLTDSCGDYVRVDVNPVAGRAMLIVEDRTEKRYSALIEKGAIQWERADDRPSSEVERKIRAKARTFSLSPADAHKLIRGFYGIRTPGVVRNRKRNGYGGVLIISCVLLAISAVVLYLSLR